MSEENLDIVYYAYAQRKTSGGRSIEDIKISRSLEEVVEYAEEFIEDNFYAHDIENLWEVGEGDIIKYLKDEKSQDQLTVFIKSLTVS